MKRKWAHVYDDHVSVAYTGSERASLLSPTTEEHHRAPQPLGKYSSAPQLYEDEPVVVFLRDELTNQLIDIQVWDKLPSWWSEDPVEEPTLNPEYMDAYNAIREEHHAREPRGTDQVQ